MHPISTSILEEQMTMSWRFRATFHLVAIAPVVAMIAITCALAVADNVKAMSLITNGDFETPQYISPPFQYLTNGDTTHLPGWTASDDSIGEQSYVYNIAGYPTSEFHSGTQAVLLNQGSGLQTTFPVIAGKRYELSLYITSATGDPFQPLSSFSPLQISAAGSTTTYTSSALNSPLSQFTFEFTASSTDPTAIMSLYNPSSVGDFKAYAIDAVSVTEVPEPATMFLSVIGAAFVVYCHRRFSPF